MQFLQICLQVQKVKQILFSLKLCLCNHYLKKQQLYFL
nr:MAG TPA: hypothetical protein [Caudoviricetes sp.]